MKLFHTLLNDGIPIPTLRRTLGSLPLLRESTQKGNESSFIEHHAMLLIKWTSFFMLEYCTHSDSILVTFSTAKRGIVKIPWSLLSVTYC